MEKAVSSPVLTETMCVYQINAYAGSGGAAIAAMRLNQGLNQAGVDSRFLSPSQNGSASRQIESIRFGNSLREKVWRRWRRFQLGRLRAQYQPRPSAFDLFGYDLSCYGMALLQSCRGAGLLNFHWMSDLLDYPFVLPRLDPKVPVVWTLHDMNPATGGCYHPRDCRAFQTQCGRCPELGSKDVCDLSTRIWRRKSKSLQKLRARLALVAPSQWMAGEVRRSSLLQQFPVHHIPNGLDTNLFCPGDRRQKKAALGIDPSRPVILFVAAALDNPWKGLPQLTAAMPLILARRQDAQFVAVGETRNGGGWPVPVRMLGPKGETEMASVYAAADVLVVPSTAENFPNVILEAMACGVPAVGFRVGGIPEAILDGETGMLAPDRNPHALAEAVCHLLDNVLRNRDKWEQKCRERAIRDYALEVQAGRYSSLYNSLIRN